jgi:AAA+ superfamily predicted ATPase
MSIEFEFLQQWIQQRLKENTTGAVTDLMPQIPAVDLWQLPLGNFVKEKNLTLQETVLLLITLVPHIYPDFFDTIIQQQIPNAGDFPRFGGVRGKNFRGFLPTGETALFLLAGENWQDRMALHTLFSADHFFAKDRILWLEDVPLGEPAMSGKIILSAEYIELFITGKASRPHFNSSFPAKLIQTQMHWEDLVLGEEIMQQIKELEQWLQHHPTLMRDWGMQGRFKKGYRVLFHGPPGTGKTLTAGLLGKYTGRDVYKIDLSMVVSKYIGETEKNLEHLFLKAEAKNWILFFDEADALFGKRTGVRDAHDKYANQEVSYLLQRIEDFDGLVILASNMKNNIDDAFIRRFNSIIRFPLPSETDRAVIWKKSFPQKIRFNDNIDIPDMVKKYELTGGNINNIVQYSCLKALEKSRQEIFLDDVLNGIKREMHKEGKAFNGNGKSILS